MMPSSGGGTQNIRLKPENKNRKVEEVIWTVIRNQEKIKVASASYVTEQAE